MRVDLFASEYFFLKYLFLVINGPNCLDGGIYSCKNGSDCLKNGNCLCQFGFTGRTCDICNFYARFCYFVSLNKYYELRFGMQCRRLFVM